MMGRRDYVLNEDEQPNAEPEGAGPLPEANPHQIPVRFQVVNLLQKMRDNNKLISKAMDENSNTIKQVERLADQFVTQAELQELRDNVKKVEEKANRDKEETNKKIEAIAKMIERELLLAVKGVAPVPAANGNTD